MWQAQWVASQLNQRGIESELVVITTQGDSTAGPLSQGGGQGLFTKEIQRELLASNVDVAVHSLKDLPTQPVDGLLLAAIPSRENTADCLISRGGQAFVDLPPGARLGTGSARRAAQLRAWRSDIEILDIRGNVDSRLRKLEEGQFDAIVLAAAGLTRLKLMQHVSEQLPHDRVLPAVGQGALGLECRQEDDVSRMALEKLNDPSAQASVFAEREMLKTLMAGCLAPVAALGTVNRESLCLVGRVISLDGQQRIELAESGTTIEAVQIGRRLGERLLEKGANSLMAQSRDKSSS